MVSRVTNDGVLAAGMVVRMPSGDVCYVESVNEGSALVVPVTAHEKPITTRKRVTKMVMVRRPPYTISRTAPVEIIDPDSGYAKAIRGRYDMSDETNAAQGNADIRNQRIYIRTDKKVEREMKGQGAVVMKVLDEQKQGTLSSISELCKGKFQTRQSVERVVGFYLSKFKREGYLRSEAPVETSASEKSEQSTETAAVAD